jgi:hypothetical protein
MQRNSVLGRCAKLAGTAICCIVLAASQSSAGELLGSDQGGIGSSIGSAAGSLGGAVGSAAGSLGGTVGSAAGAVGGTLGSTAGSLGGAVGSATRSVGSTVGSATDGTIGGVTGGIAGAGRATDSDVASPVSRSISKSEFSRLVRRLEILLQCKDLWCARNSRSNDAGPRVRLRNKVQLLAACDRVFRERNRYSQETVDICAVVTAL